MTPFSSLKTTTSSFTVSPGVFSAPITETLLLQQACTAQRKRNRIGHGGGGRFEEKERTRSRSARKGRGGNLSHKERQACRPSHLRASLPRRPSLPSRLSLSSRRSVLSSHLSAFGFLIFLGCLVARKM
jgi:hypothetical protein